MNNLKDFLVRFGLSKHDNVFRANSIDLEILPDLAEADLKELGLDLGDRKRMMRALKALANEGLPATPGLAEAPQ
ncbi:MAG: SAM domain-containing protein, partial [Pseudomonadota bacterium]